MTQKVEFLQKILQIVSKKTLCYENLNQRQTVMKKTKIMGQTERGVGKVPLFWPFLFLAIFFLPSDFRHTVTQSKNDV